MVFEFYRIQIEHDFRCFSQKIGIFEFLKKIRFFYHSIDLQNHQKPHIFGVVRFATGSKTSQMNQSDEFDEKLRKLSDFLFETVSGKSVRFVISAYKILHKMPPSMVIYSIFRIIPTFIESGCPNTRVPSQWPAAQNSKNFAAFVNAYYQCQILTLQEFNVRECLVLDSTGNQFNVREKIFFFETNLARALVFEGLTVSGLSGL